MTRPAAKEARGLIVLAAPIIAAHVGNQMMGFVDTAMVGRLGAAAVGGVGIGSGIFFTLSLVAMGCALGMDPLVTQAIGAGEHGLARRIHRNGVLVGVVASVPIMAAILLVPLALPLIGVKPEVIATTREYLWGRVWNAVPLAIFGAARSYLQAAGHTRPIVIATVVANVVNFVCNAIFIYGDGALTAIGLPAIGLPALGPFGAGLASTISAIVSLWVVFAAIRAVGAPTDRRGGHDPELVRRIVTLGLPIGLHLLAEVSAFALVSVLSGRIGSVAAAGNQIALALASMSFMVPMGISSATAVRVGQAVGRGDQAGARRAGLVGFAAGVGFMSFSAAAFLLFPGPLARILTNQPDVVAAALPLVQVAALFQLFDGLQVVGAGALRGAGETSSTLIANLVGHFVIGLPLAILLAFPAGLGGAGLWWGLSAGLTTVGVTLIARFLWLSARPLRRA